MSKDFGRDIVLAYMDQSPLPVPAEPSKPPSGPWREVFSTAGILLTALLVALFIIGFIFRSYQVDGPSMETTLENADKLIIWKVPRSWARITRHSYIPKRGDIVVFNESGLSEFGQEDSKQLIKRVIGLPGDHVIVNDGKVKIYNQAHQGGFEPDATLPYGKNIPDTSGNVDVTLAKDQLFVMGDNRPDSLDSRAFGPIKANQLVGKLVLRLFPVSQAEAF
jgi:signal peptidase I